MGCTRDWGTPSQRRIDRVTTDELGGPSFAAGSMGPKVEAAVEFVKATGHRAAIGSLDRHRRDGRRNSRDEHRSRDA